MYRTEYRTECDSLEGFDRINNKFLDIDIINPRTHIRRGKAVFTDYEIHVKTNHPEFALKESRVRRRYSEFAWLKQRLGLNDVMMVTAPSLPGKRYIGRFKEKFVRERQIGLQNFMNNVIEINAFLSEPALHFFLQSTVPIPEMEYHLLHASVLSNIRDIIIQSNDAKERKVLKKQTIQAKCDRLRRSLSLDSLPPSSRVVEKTPQQQTDGRGRGWSRYIGEGYHSFAVSTPDAVDYGGNLSLFRPRSLTTNACVLPGGKIRLAGTRAKSANKAIPVKESMGAKKLKRTQISSSWHGCTHDMIDLFLDDYEVISQDTIEKTAMSDIESISTTDTSPSQHHFDSYSDASSDDGIEIDITERLKEYNIIAMPERNWFNWDQQFGVYD